MSVFAATIESFISFLIGDRVKITAFQENWALKDSFAISRGSKTSVDVVVVRIEDGDAVGVGESVPYSRYGQSVDDTLNTIRAIAENHAGDLTQELLLHEYPPDAARNALDCALWDLDAKRANKPVWLLAGLPAPKKVAGAYSLSIDSPRQLAKNAKARSMFPLLKVKLGNDRVVESIEAVRQACPQARIIVDANEAWSLDEFVSIVPEFIKLGVEMIEQPLPADNDEELEGIDCEIQLCADESFHNGEDLNRLANRYDIFNIKLDKTGGLTGALMLANAIKAAGKKIMVGSMMATSLSLAPAMLLAHEASYVDLDSPVWIANDRPGGLRFENGTLYPAERTFWG